LFQISTTNRFKLATAGAAIFSVHQDFLFPSFFLSSRTITDLFGCTLINFVRFQEIDICSYISGFDFCAQGNHPKE